ncbi:MAG TPA: hypothetical protein VF595_01950 [Tepidisphaeraceae bacterium]|jgi:hypothetical protein
MTPLPDNLTEDDLTLLHLAGELPNDVDRGVAQRLSDDPLASRALRDAWTDLHPLLAVEAAASARTVGPAGVAARAVVAAMREIEPPRVDVPRRRLRGPPGWAVYPAAAAAAIVLGMTGWWYHVHDEQVVKNNRPTWEPAPALLVLRGGPDQNPSRTTDDDLEDQFETMIVPERGVGFERQLAAIEYLKEAVQ